MGAMAGGGWKYLGGIEDALACGEEEGLGGGVWVGGGGAEGVADWWGPEIDPWAEGEVGGGGWRGGALGDAEDFGGEGEGFG